jgi:hypothetical protein
MSAPKGIFSSAFISEFAEGLLKKNNSLISLE